MSETGANSDHGTPLLLERFERTGFDPRLVWSNAPPAFRNDERGLTIETAANTDLWQRTHYGFRAENAHALLATVTSDFRLETEVVFEPAHQYDQAGLLVWISNECWLKTSIEFEPGEPSRLGSVVTNAAWSDWATQDIPGNVRHARYRVVRRSGDYTVQAALKDGTFSQLRLARLHEDDGSRPIRAGIYACSPKAAGFQASFRFLSIDTF